MNEPVVSAQDVPALGDIFARAWKIFSNNFTTILLIVLVVQVPLNVVLWAVTPDRILSGQEDTISQQQDLIDNNQTDQVDTAKLITAVAEINGYGFATNIFADMAGAVATMALIVLAARRSEGREVDFKYSFSRSLPRWPAGALTALMLGVAVVLLYFALIVPGIIFDIFWTFSLQAVVLRGKTGAGALSYSYRVVKRRWWKVFLYSFVFGLTAVVIREIISSLNRFGNNALAAIVFAVLIAVLLSFFTIAYTVFFLELDKKEVEAAAAQLQAG